MASPLRCVLCAVVIATGSAQAAAPVAVDDEFSTPQDQVLEVMAPGVLANDTDADGDALTAAVVSLPASGTLTLGPSGDFTYTPNTGFYGSDSFSYEADDGSGTSNAGVVALTVTRYGVGDDSSGYAGGGYGAMSPWLLALLALAALYPRGLKRSNRRCISP